MNKPVKKFRIWAFLVGIIMVGIITFPDSETRAIYQDTELHAETSTFDAPFGNIIMLMGR